jgi:hypothetical protein
MLAAGVGLMFIWLAWRGFEIGRAGGFPIGPTRRHEPVSFWLLQAVLAMNGLGSLAFAAVISWAAVASGEWL